MSEYFWYVCTCFWGQSAQNVRRMWVNWMGLFQTNSNDRKGIVCSNHCIYITITVTPPRKLEPKGKAPQEGVSQNSTPQPVDIAQISPEESPVALTMDSPNIPPNASPPPLVPSPDVMPPPVPPPQPPMGLTSPLTSSEWAGLPNMYDLNHVFDKRMKGFGQINRVLILFCVHLKVCPNE